MSVQTWLAPVFFLREHMRRFHKCDKQSSSQIHLVRNRTSRIQFELNFVFLFFVEIAFGDLLQFRMC